MFTVDVRVRLGPLDLKNPVVAASGTFGLGMELAKYVDPAALGAVTVKSLSINPWPGNESPRLTTTPAGMLNSVGLQNPGTDAWIHETLPALRETGATIIASVWGRTVGEFVDAASAVGTAEGVAAVELNLSCPNIESADEIFAHSSRATANIVGATRSALGIRGLPIIAKLSPNTLAICDVADAAMDAGADVLTLINTVLGMRIDPRTGEHMTARAPAGLSGPAIRPIAVRAVYEVASRLPTAPIIGTGGVSDGASAAEMLAAGASAVGVGTATFHDPRAALKVLRQLGAWCDKNGFRSVTELTERSRSKSRDS